MMPAFVNLDSVQRSSLSATGALPSAVVRGSHLLLNVVIADFDSWIPPSSSMAPWHQDKLFLLMDTARDPLRESYSP